METRIWCSKRNCIYFFPRACKVKDMGWIIHASPKVACIPPEIRQENLQHTTSLYQTQWRQDLRVLNIYYGICNTSTCVHKHKSRSWEPRKVVIIHIGNCPSGKRPYSRWHTSSAEVPVQGRKETNHFYERERKSFLSRVLLRMETLQSQNFKALDLPGLKSITNPSRFCTKLDNCYWSLTTAMVLLLLYNIEHEIWKFVKMLYVKHISGISNSVMSVKCERGDWRSRFGWNCSPARLIEDNCLCLFQDWVN